MFNGVLDNCPKNPIIGKSLLKTYYRVNDPMYKKIICSISGGSDSDILLDICSRVDFGKKITYVFFNTGLEYQATKEHLDYLEKKYNIKIEREKVCKTVAVSCREYGVPFISKNVSEMISRLQRHNFRWEDKPFDVLHSQYPNCKSALEWWCNSKRSKRMGIGNNKWLKEFLIANPPQEKISNKCCSFAKKGVALRIIREGGYTLELTGIRKGEGGARGLAYKTCFDNSYANCDRYRPIFWFLKDTKLAYEEHYGVTHSRCYSEYGLTRTGCAGCPFGRDFEFELEVIKKYEPKLYLAVNNIFGKIYEYTRAFQKFKKSKE